MEPERLPDRDHLVHIRNCEHELLLSLAPRTLVLFLATITLAGRSRLGGVTRPRRASRVPLTREVARRPGRYAAMSYARRHAEEGRLPWVRPAAPHRAPKWLGRER